MPNDDDDDTGRRRRFSESEVDEFLRVQRVANEQTREADRQDRMEALYAEWFGFDGRGGKLSTMEATVRTHGKDIAELKIVRARAEFWASTIKFVAVGIGGLIAGLAFKLVDWIIK